MSVYKTHQTIHLKKGVFFIVCKLYLNKHDFKKILPITPSSPQVAELAEFLFVPQHRTNFCNIPCAMVPGSLAVPENWVGKQRGPAVPPPPLPLRLGVCSDSGASFKILSAV